jgi:hypothetical protein
MRFAPRLLLLITCLGLLPAPVRAVDGERFELDGDLRRTGGGVD